MAITVDTREFEQSHGHRPRGYGSWGFTLRGIQHGVYTVREFWAHGTYGDARKQALAVLRGAREASVEVLP